MESRIPLVAIKARPGMTSEAWPAKIVRTPLATEGHG